MLEVAILLAACLALIVAFLAGWRLLRGPAPGKWHALLRLTAVCLLIVPLAAWSTWRWSKSRHVQLFSGMVSRVETARPVVALTFDDGPLPGSTAQVLQILEARGVRATFFVVGRDVEQHMPEAQRIVAGGHELGNHSYSHPRMIARSYAFVRDEVERTNDLIRAAGYAGDIHFRPPYGKRLIVLPYYLYRTGQATIFMDVEPESYPEIAGDPQRIADHVLDNVRPGSIVLLHVMHDGRAASVQALPAVIEGLQGKGYEFVTVSELLALGTQ